VREVGDRYSQDNRDAGPPYPHPNNAVHVLERFTFSPPIASRHARPFTELRNQYLAALTDNIKSRFPDMPLLLSISGLFSLRDIIGCAVGPARVSYGKEQLSAIAIHFQQMRFVGVPEASPRQAVLNVDLLGVEYTVYKQMAAPLYNAASALASAALLPPDSRHRGPRALHVTLSHNIKAFLTSQIAPELPNLSKLARIALSIPVSTADVERGFSTMKAIKTIRRLAFVLLICFQFIVHYSD
jgi:hypothetical protein